MTTTTAAPTKPRLQRHERLTAWQACHALTRACYKATFGWHAERPDPLAEEIQLSAMRAAVHVRTGVEESTKEGFRRELQIATGKLARLECALDLARETGRLSAESFGELEAGRDHADKLVRGLHIALGRKKPAGK